jgi:hypothetical protein
MRDSDSDQRLRAGADLPRSWPTPHSVKTQLTSFLLVMPHPVCPKPTLPPVAAFLSLYSGAALTLQHGSSAQRGHATRAPSAGRAADNERQEDKHEMA